MLFGAAHESSGRTKIAVSSNSSEADARVVAIDDEGHKYTLIPTYALKTGGFQQLEVEFANPLSQIKELQFQTQPFEWAEFTNVVLNPLEKREVK